MSISSEISRISQNVADSLEQVALKGVTVPAGSNSDDLPDLIAQITGGGGYANVGIINVADYGAVGDGVTDDSQAVQDACDAGYDVYFESNKTYYLASTVTIDHDCHLHGGENTVIKTKTPSGGTINDGIVVSGTLKKTTTMTTDYSSIGSTNNSGNQFTLSDMTDINIGDIMVITAEDQFYHYARQYYYLGAVLLVSDVYDGHIYTSNSMPWDIENTANVSVKIYSAPTAIIENLDFVSDLDSMGAYKYQIDLKWCKNSIIRNCNMTESGNMLRMYYSFGTLVDNVTVSKAKYSDSLNGDSYGIYIHSSSETIVQRVNAICSGGCVEMSGQIPCINTYVRNCNLASECRTAGLSLHENSYNTVVEDCTLSGAMTYGTMRFVRCRFIVSNRKAGSSALNFCGSHNAQFSTLYLEDCNIDGTRTISIDRPTGQNPVQSYDNIIGLVEIHNCTGGAIQFAPTTNTEVLSNTIKEFIIDGWKDCNKVYHTAGNIIESMKIKNSTFLDKYFLTKNTSAFFLDDILYLDYSTTNPPNHKVYKGKTVYADNPVLPEGVPIQLSSSNNSAVFRICGENITPNVAEDWLVGSVSGSTGETLTRTTSNYATVTIDANGNPVYTQGSNTSSAAMYPVGMTYVEYVSTVTITAKIKNTGATNGASFRPYIAIVDCKTGKVTYRSNGTGGTADASGVTISHTYTVLPNCVVLCYFYCNSAVNSAVTTFENMSITVSPGFIAPVITEKYQSKRRTGDGTLTSFAGVNNIMCSENTFTVQYGADLMRNPIGLLESGEGVSF